MGEEPALWMRHTQGDLWDLMLLYPMAGLSANFAPARTARIDQAKTTTGRTGADLQREIDANTA